MVISPTLHTFQLAIGMERCCYQAIYDLPFYTQILFGICQHDADLGLTACLVIVKVDVYLIQNTTLSLAILMRYYVIDMHALVASRVSTAWMSVALPFRHQGGQNQTKVCACLNNRF